MENNNGARQRAYAGMQDLQAMLNLIEQRPGSRIADFPSFTDLREMMGTPEAGINTALWEDAEGRLIGFAILDKATDSASLTFEIAPGWPGKGLTGQMVAWAENALEKAVECHHGLFDLEASSRSDDLERISSLVQSGFEQQKEGAVHMERSLAKPLPTPQLPSGFLIRSLGGEREAEAWVELHRAAWGTKHMTLDYKLAMMRTPDYSPDMDLVAVTSDGRMAAYCVCFISAEENRVTGYKRGYTDPIATHPAFQRRGLSKALMITGMRLLKQRGMETACLGTSNDNLAMIRTAASVGFRVVANTLRYSKSIRSSKQKTVNQSKITVSAD